MPIAEDPVSHWIHLTDSGISSWRRVEALLIIISVKLVFLLIYGEVSVSSIRILVDFPRNDDLIFGSQLEAEYSDDNQQELTKIALWYKTSLITSQVKPKVVYQFPFGSFLLVN